MASIRRSPRPPPSISRVNLGACNWQIYLHHVEICRRNLRGGGGEALNGGLAWLLETTKTQKSPQKTTAGGGKEAPRRGQRPEHPCTPDNRTAPPNTAREFVPLLALPESSGPLMRGGGRQAKLPPLPQRPIDPGCNTKPRRRGLNEGSQSLVISIGFAGLWQARHARRLCQVGR